MHEYSEHAAGTYSVRSQFISAIVQLPQRCGSAEQGANTGELQACSVRFGDIHTNASRRMPYQNVPERGSNVELADLIPAILRA